MASVMSTVEPAGTWQYAQKVCPPLVGSAAYGWTASTYGRGECRPALVSASLSAISSSVPPRCTVPASATAGSRHGTGPSRAQSILKTPGPYRKRASRRR